MLTEMPHDGRVLKYSIHFFTQSLSYFLQHTTHANTIATCFAVVLTKNHKTVFFCNWSCLQSQMFVSSACNNYRESVLSVIQYYPSEYM